MDKESIKKYAFLLEGAIEKHKGSHRDVDFLATYDPLIEAIERGKEGSINYPCNIGLSRWELESNIRDVPDVSHLLSIFELMIEGWDLSYMNKYADSFKKPGPD